MKQLFLLFSLTFLLLISFPAFSADGKKAASRFSFSYEEYSSGSIHFGNSSYLFISFDVEESDGLYRALLTKSIVYEGIGNTFDTSYSYQETGEGASESGIGEQGVILQFLKNHPLQFRLENHRVVMQNTDSLTAVLEQLDTKKRHRLFAHSFGVGGLRDIFQQLFFQQPKELRSPGDLFLKNGVIYNYKCKTGAYRNVELVNAKRRSKSLVFIADSSYLVRFRQSRGGTIRVFPADTSFNTIISGTFPKEKKQTISFNAKAASPLIDDEKFSANTNEQGHFRLTLNLKEPVTLRTNNGFEFYAEPGDEYSFTSNEAQDSLQFWGIGAENNNFLQAEARLEKLGKPDWMRDKKKQEQWFKRVDRLTDEYWYLLKLYGSDLSPRFYESKFLDYYYGKVNSKLDYVFGWFDYDSTVKKFLRSSIDLDTVPEYQSFVYSHSLNKFVENRLLLSFENLRGFVYLKGVDSPAIPTKSELIQLAALSKSGKGLRDFLEYSTREIFYRNDQEAIDILEDLVRKHFDGSLLQQRIHQLKMKEIAVVDDAGFPAIDLRNLENKAVYLSDFKGQVLYVLFWRNDALVLDKPWQKFQQLAKEMQNEDVRFVTIGMEEDFESWKNYVSGMEMSSLNLFVDRNSEDFQKYFRGLRSRHFFLIDKNGNIVNTDGPAPSVASYEIPQYVGASQREKLLLSGLVVLGIVLLLGALGWLISRARSKRRAKIENLVNQLRETELKAIKAQMNPHFLFNSLNSIQNLINQHKIEGANKYLSRFARLLRAVLQHSEKEFIPLADELETLTLYVQLEKLRFNFNYELVVDASIDIHNTFIPPLLLQPFIENAILHGLQLKAGEKKLQIRIIQEGGQITCYVEDNGVGFRDSKAQAEGHHGIGNKLSRERLNLLNAKNNSNFKLTIEEADADGGGTRVAISYGNQLI